MFPLSDFTRLRISSHAFTDLGNFPADVLTTLSYLVELHAARNSSLGKYGGGHDLPDLQIHGAGGWVHESMGHRRQGVQGWMREARAHSGVEGRMRKPRILALAPRPWVCVSALSYRNGKL